MADIVTTEQLQNASLDAQALEKAVNGTDAEDVLTRLGATYPTLRKAIKQIFKTGGLPATPYRDYNSMTASSLPVGSYAVVTESAQSQYNGLYIKETSGWVKSKYDFVSQNNSNIQSGIDEVKNLFISTGKNLFNHTDYAKGYISSTGEHVASDSYSVTGFISIKRGATYTVSRSVVTGASTKAFTSVSFYDANKVFISLKTLTHNPSSGVYSESFAAPSDAYFARLAFNGDPLLYQRMFNIGSEVLPHELYYVQLKDIRLSDKAVLGIEQAVKNGLGSYIETSYNLFNYEDVMLGYYVSDTGEILKDSSQTYAVSGFIPVESGRYTYVSDVGYNAFIHTAVYDINKNFIKRVNTSAENGWRPIIFGTSEAFIRVNINSGRPDERHRMIIKGDVAKPYVTHRSVIKNVELSEAIIKELHDKNGYNLVRYDSDISGVFNTTVTEGWTGFEEREDNPNNWRFNKTADVYALYDALYEQHIPYISKKELGKDANGTSIYQYTFRPEKPSVFGKTRHAVIAIVCGIHGYEHVSALATYLMLEQVCNNWRSSPQLEAMRWNVEFIIVPVAVPHGWDNRTRGNPNGVDINRNFPHNWEFGDNDPNSAYYRGLSAGSELETKYIMKLIDENYWYIDAFFDFHNFGGTPTERRYIWVASEDPKNQTIQVLANSLIGRMSRKFHKEYTFLSTYNAPTMLGNASSSFFPVGGLSSDYAYNKGIKLSCTFELCERWWVDPNSVRYDVTHTKTMMEAITNWVLINMEEIEASSRLK